MSLFYYLGVISAFHLLLSYSFYTIAVNNALREPCLLLTNSSFTLRLSHWVKFESQLTSSSTLAWFSDKLSQPIAARVILNLYYNCYHNSTYVVIFEINDVIYFQPILGKFSKIKVQKSNVVMFAVDWNLARYPGKTCCVQKCKKKRKKRIWSYGPFKFFLDSRRIPWSLQNIAK